MKVARFKPGDAVTIPDGHGRESGLVGKVIAIEDNAIGRFYQVAVASSRTVSGIVIVPVLLQVLDILSAHPERTSSHSHVL